MKGMDVELVSEFGDRMRNEVAERVRDLKTTVTGLSRGLNWEGPDAQQFNENEMGALGTALDRLAEQIIEFGRVALDNASAQADISARL
jgi:hypothetical protein